MRATNEATVHCAYLVAALTAGRRASWRRAERGVLLYRSDTSLVIQTAVRRSECRA